MGIFSESYVNRLTSPSDLASLVELQGVIISSPLFDPDEPACGLPANVFAFVEIMTWLSQSVRSGSWTYFESTSEERIKALLHVLEAVAPKGLVDQYRFGANHWVEAKKLTTLDRWIANSERDLDAWLREFVHANKAEFQALIT